MATLLKFQQKFIVLFFPSGGKVQMPLRLRLQDEWKIAHTFKGNSLRPGLGRRTAVGGTWGIGGLGKWGGS
jgi:hypothetical protein